MAYSSLDKDVVVTGKTNLGTVKAAAVTAEGHYEVEVHAPLNPFGSIHVEGLEVQFQNDAVYGINTSQINVASTLSGTATASDSNFICTTGTTQYGFGTIQSRRRLRYRPGQGVVGRFTALFNTPVASSIQVVGFGHGEDGVFLGYNGLNFGILYSTRGVREVRTLTITTKSSTIENVVVTLNSVAFNVAVTNGATTIATAYEISKGAYAGWDAEQVGSTVIFVKNSVGSANLTYSIAGTSVVGTFARTSIGAATTDTWTYQSSWNGDSLLGTGPTGFLINPQRYNVFQIGIQYLGAGVIHFKCETTDPIDGNNATWTSIHEIKLPNTLTTTSFGNPSFPFTMAAYSAGSTTDVTVKSGSHAGFIEGVHALQGPRFSYINTLTSVTASAFQVLFTIRNGRYFKTRTNQSVVYLISISAAIKHTSPVVVSLIRDATLAGVPNFSSWGTNSCTYFDNAATTATYSNNEQLIWSGIMGDTGDIDFIFNDDITLQPGETISLVAKSSTGTPAYVSGSINTREDQ